jgi:hypothetical protein
MARRRKSVNGDQPPPLTRIYVWLTLSKQQRSGCVVVLTVTEGCFYDGTGSASIVYLRRACSFPPISARSHSGSLSFAKGPLWRCGHLGFGSVVRMRTGDKKLESTFHRLESLYYD